jgi:hypothetical protein
MIVIFIVIMIITTIIIMIIIITTTIITTTTTIIITIINTIITTTFSMPTTAALIIIITYVFLLPPSHALTVVDDDHVPGVCRLIVALLDRPQITTLSLPFVSECVSHEAWRREELPLPPRYIQRQGWLATLEFIKVLPPVSTVCCNVLHTARVQQPNCA